MDVLDALIEATEEAGWNATQLAVAAGLGEGAAKKWLARLSVPGGDTVITLMRRMPGFRARLGFEIGKKRAAVA